MLATQIEHEFVDGNLVQGVLAVLAVSSSHDFLQQLILDHV